MKLASLETIKEILPHTNADRLELAKVNGWQCVVKKGEFRVGEEVVFIVIDTILPKTQWSAFLDKGGEREIRLRTVKLRGEYSQGLLLPRSILDAYDERGLPLNEGDDVSEIIGVKKYEKEIPAGLAGIALGPFPSNICSSTDEENGLADVESSLNILQEKITVTRKLDGSSCTVVVEGGKIAHVCSRRLRLQEAEESGFWKVAKTLNIEGCGDDHLVIQGELMGPKVQGNQLRLKNAELHVFQVRVNGQFLSYDEMNKLCQNTLGCPVVPCLGHFEPGLTLEKLQELADCQMLDSGDVAEGIVVRPHSYRKGGHGRPEGFKIINRNYRDL